jgi:hypothetical protein
MLYVIELSSPRLALIFVAALKIIKLNKLVKKI